MVLGGAFALRLASWRTSCSSAAAQRRAPGWRRAAAAIIARVPRAPPRALVHFCATLPEPTRDALPPAELSALLLALGCQRWRYARWRARTRSSAVRTPPWAPASESAAAEDWAALAELRRTRDVRGSSVRHRASIYPLPVQSL